MPFNINCLIYRKPGMTIEDFVKHYEERHIPWIYDFAGSKAPLRHTRRYVHRQSQGDATVGGPSNKNTPATIIRGNQDDVDYDVLVEMSFEDKAAFEAFVGVFAGPDAAAKLKEDEESFVDPTKTVIWYESQTMTTEKS